MVTKNKKIRIGIVGIEGRMGKSIALAVLKSSGVELVSGIEHSKHKMLGKDIGIINSLVNMYGEDKKNINFKKYYLLWSPWNTVASWYLWRNIDQKIISY